MSWQREDADRRAYQRAAYTEENIERTCIMVDRIALIKCVKDAIETSREDQRAGYDLTAQENMASWAWWLLLSSVATILTAGIGIFYVRETLIEGQRANAIAREIGNDQMRAYVHAESAEVGEWVQLPFTVKIRNTGQTPATDVNFYAEVDSVEIRGETDPADFRYDSSAIGTDWGELENGGYVDLNFGTDDDYDKVREVNGAKGRRSLIVRGRVRYKTIFDEDFETEFAFHANEVRARREKSGGRTVEIPEMLSRPPIKRIAYRKLEGNKRA